MPERSRLRTGPVVSPTVTATVDLPVAVVVPVLPNTGDPAEQMLLADLLTLLTGAALPLRSRRRSTHPEVQQSLC